MNNDNNPNVNFGGNILTTLQLIFLVLKLNGLINWSWWQVLIPGIIEIALIIILLIVVAIVIKRDNSK